MMSVYSVKEPLFFWHLIAKLEINNFAFILKWNRKVFFGKAKINHLLTNEAKKIKKSQCLHCSEIFTNRSIKSHSQNCQFYAKLIKNGLECSVCLKSFESREAVNRHIGHNHKEALSEIKQKSNLENKNELSTQEGENDVCEQEIDIKLEKTDLENPTPEPNPDTVTGDLFLLCHRKKWLKKPNNFFSLHCHWCQDLYQVHLFH